MTWWYSVCILLSECSPYLCCCCCCSIHRLLYKCELKIWVPLLCTMTWTWSIVLFPTRPLLLIACWYSFICKLYIQEKDVDCLCRQQHLWVYVWSDGLLSCWLWNKLERFAMVVPVVKDFFALYKRLLHWLRNIHFENLPLIFHDYHSTYHFMRDPRNCHSCTVSCKLWILYHSMTLALRKWQSSNSRCLLPTWMRSIATPCGKQLKRWLNELSHHLVILSVLYKLLPSCHLVLVMIHSSFASIWYAKELSSLGFLMMHYKGRGRGIQITIACCLFELWSVCDTFKNHYVFYPCKYIFVMQIKRTFTLSSSFLKFFCFKESYGSILKQWPYFRNDHEKLRSVIMICLGQTILL